jgi:hypothetical protein
MTDDKPQTDVLQERDAGRPKDVRGNAPPVPAERDTDPQFPGGEYPANDQPLPGKRDSS